MIKQFFCQFFRNIKIFFVINFFQIYNLKIIKNKKVKNINCYYLFYRFFNKFINILEFAKYYVVVLRNHFDLEFDKIHFTKLNYEDEKHIIVDNTCSQKKITFENIKEHIHNQNDENMQKNLILKFDLIHEGKNICLKDFIIKYKDDENIYDHNLENILQFNNIKFNGESKILLRYFKGKMIEKEFELKNIKSQHINSFFI